MSTLDRLRELLARDFDLAPERLQPDATLESLEIDSLRMIEILFTVEDEFAISVPAEHNELKSRLKTLGDLAEYLDGLVAAKAQGAV
jgi:acyl carrier protein